MDEKETTPVATVSSDVMPGAKFVDTRPTDLQVFFMLLPSVLGGFASKSADSRSANASAFVCVREALGQCAVMGIMRAVTMCNDGSPLASMMNNQVPLGVQPTASQQPSGHGSMVQQYPNQPGQGQPGSGGVVTQYPNHVPQGGGNGGANGNKGVMIAMFPNNQPPPQL